MKRHGILAIALLALAPAGLVPGVANASHEVDVDVEIRTGHHGKTWVEFSPSHGAFVALYATMSDGTLHTVFPGWSTSHWVDARDVRVVPVYAPYGIRVRSVQAVASYEWFDPAATWVASSPGCDPYHPYVIHSVSRVPFVSFHFEIGWHGSSHRPRVVRSSRGWTPRATHPPKWKANAGHAHPGWAGHGRDHSSGHRTVVHDSRGRNDSDVDSDSDRRGRSGKDGSWKQDRSEAKSSKSAKSAKSKSKSKSGSAKAKVVASSGGKSSGGKSSDRPGDSGEPKGRSRR